MASPSGTACNKPARLGLRWHTAVPARSFPAIAGQARAEIQSDCSGHSFGFDVPTRPVFLPCKNVRVLLAAQNTKALRPEGGNECVLNKLLMRVCGPARELSHVADSNGPEPTTVAAKAQFYGSAVWY